MFKKIFGYFKYRKIISENYIIISQRYKFKFDKIYGRLYTVLNVTEERQEVLKTYGYDYLDGEVKKYITSIEDYFFSIGMLELISISRIDTIDAVNVLVVLRYKYNKHQAFLYIILGLFGTIFLSAFLAGFVKLLIFLVNFIISF